MKDDLDWKLIRLCKLPCVEECFVDSNELTISLLNCAPFEVQEVKEFLEHYLGLSLQLIDVKLTWDGEVKIEFEIVPGPVIVITDGVQSGVVEVQSSGILSFSTLCRLCYF